MCSAKPTLFAPAIGPGSAIWVLNLQHISPHDIGIHAPTSRRLMAANGRYPRLRVTDFGQDKWVIVSKSIIQNWDSTWLRHCLAS
jgi:hypothetical protein